MANTNTNSSVFTTEQCQQLLALIAPSSPLVSTVQGKELSLTNGVSSFANAMLDINLSHSVFSAKVVNRRAFSPNT